MTRGDASRKCVSGLGSGTHVADDIAVWLVDTEYDYDSVFVRRAHVPGAKDPYKALKTTLKAEIDVDAWESLKRTRARPFPRRSRPPARVVHGAILRLL